jgi:hypothetical protein
VTMSTSLEKVDGGFVIVTGDIVGIGAVNNNSDGSKVGSTTVVVVGVNVVILMGGGVFAVVVGEMIRTGARTAVVVVGTRMGVCTVPVGGRGRTLGVRTTIGARTGVRTRRTGAGAIPTTVG